MPENINRHTTAEINRARDTEANRILAQNIINGLSFPEIYTRESNITESFEDTFTWIFQHDGTRPWSDFVNWLKNGNDLYWINGKAGSGKSTLMKFVAVASTQQNTSQIGQATNNCFSRDFSFGGLEATSRKLLQVY